MYYLPNRQYFLSPSLRDMTLHQLEQSQLILWALSFLEALSMIATMYVVSRWYDVKSMHHLAFLLRKTGGLMHAILLLFVTFLFYVALKHGGSGV